jgi:hypothetical protein
MIFRKRRTRVIPAALAAVLLAVAPWSPASAAFMRWIDAPCATGAITEYAIGVDDHGEVHVTLAGWIQPCGEPIPGATFGTMEYHTNAATVYALPGSDALHEYDSAAPTVFAVDYNLDAVEAIQAELDYGPLRALCVARDYAAPVACVGLDRPEPGGTPHLMPIAPDDPRVASVPVDRSPGNDPEDDGQYCGNCV